MGEKKTEGKAHPSVLSHGNCLVTVWLVTSNMLHTNTVFFSVLIFIKKSEKLFTLTKLMLGSPKSGFYTDPVQYLIWKRRPKTSHVQLKKKLRLFSSVGFPNFSLIYSK